jgi:hypothetical protein
MTGQSNKENTKSKVMVPKLKLEILPNYHKKIEKSLNDSLLACYEQKHGHVRQVSSNNGDEMEGEEGNNHKGFANANFNPGKKGL